MPDTRKQIREQVIVITGATSDIGLATAGPVARRDGRPVLVTRWLDGPSAETGAGILSRLQCAINLHPLLTLLALSLGLLTARKAYGGRLHARRGESAGGRPGSPALPPATLQTFNWEWDTELAG